MVCSYCVCLADLTEAPILVYPDFSKPFMLDTDASDTSIGAVLSQVPDGKETFFLHTRPGFP